MSDIDQPSENVVSFPIQGQTIAGRELLGMERIGNLDRLSKSDLAAELKFTRKILLKAVPWMRPHLTGEESVGDLASLVADVIEAFIAERTATDRRIADLEAIIHSAVNARANALGIGAQPAPKLGERKLEAEDLPDFGDE